MFKPILLTMTLAACALAADPVLLGLLPKDPGMISGIDITRAKNSELGQKILAEIKDEDKGFKELVEATGFDPRRDLREVVMATDARTGERAIVLVSGSFDQTKINALMAAKGATQSLYQGVELWKPSKAAKDDGAAAVLNSSLAVFGKEAMVKEVIDRRGTQGMALSAGLEARIKEWSVNDAWFLTTVGLAELGVNQDGKNRVMPMGITPEAIQQMSAGVRFGADVTMTAEAVTRNATEAQSLADVLKFVVGMIRLNADKPGAAEAAKVADTLQVSVDGVKFKVAVTLPAELVDKALERKHGTGARAAR